MRAGDTVKHIPSGELWTVAVTRDGELIPMGWPESLAKQADCELVEAVDDDLHMKVLLDTLAVKDPGSSRWRWARTNFIDALPQVQRQTLDGMFERAKEAESLARLYRRQVESHLQHLIDSARRNASKE